MDINQLLQYTIDKKASDLHLVPGYYPTIRINNELYSVTDSPILTEKDSEIMIFSILTPENKDNLLANKEDDIGYEFNGSRFRVNVYCAKNQYCASFRLIPSKINTFEELNIPLTISKFGQYRQGLVLFTGPTGEGKSTTLAAMINQINMTSAKHIVTIEDPIEFVYPLGKSIISQRELHQDTHSMNIALRSVLREDPDIVLVGEMRDYETIQTVLTIAETGHLVLSTLHTKSTSETIDRIIDVFPAHQQNQIRNQLSTVLVSVIAQRLLPNIDQSKRIPAFEIMINNPAVGSLIRSGRNFMLDNVLETSEEEGMILFEKYLLSLQNKGIISQETAISYAFREREIKKLLK
jgi:twitching motility protein PilT